MVLPRYLAMTRAEFTACSSLPEPMAWMACHFSPYGTGLTNLPPALPKGSMVILNDRIPMAGHDPDAVLRQLRDLDMDYLLLDLQRPPEPGSLDLARWLVSSLSCPVGVTAAFAEKLDCPLFLPLPSPDTPLAEYLAPWQGREVWLELSLEGMSCTVTEQGAKSGPLPIIPEAGHRDDTLLCHYRMTLSDDRAEFALWRTREDLDGLMEQAKAHGVTKTVSLWQEFMK